MSSGYSSSALHPSLVSASTYIHLAPPEVHRDTLSPDQIRRLVLEYLCSSCYPNSAKAFAQEAEMFSRANDSFESGDEGVIDGSIDGPSKILANGSFSNSHIMNGPIESQRTDPEEGMEGIQTSTSTSPGQPMLVGPDGTLTATNGNTLKTTVEEDENGEGSWPLLSSAMLKSVRIRKEIKDCILTGRIKSAIELSNTHFPTVLSQRAANSKSQESTVCHSGEFFIPTPSSGQINLNGKQIAPCLGSSFGPWSVSLSPQVLSLNLQLQSFVEIMRAAYSAPSSLSGPSTPTALSVNGDNVSDEGEMSTSISSLASNSPHSINIAIAHSQALNAKVQMLPPGKEKEQWIKECIDVSGLLAYKDLTTCPVRGYLAQERREVLAELLNAAILKAIGETPLPLLTLATRQTSAVWHACGDFKVHFPPPNKGGKKLHKAVPVFELKTFLRENESTAPKS